jgi:hypothetical protein
VTPEQRKRVDRGLGLVSIGFLFYSSLDLLGDASAENWIWATLFTVASAFFLRDLLRERAADKLISGTSPPNALDGPGPQHLEQRR